MRKIVGLIGDDIFYEYLKNQGYYEQIQYGLAKNIKNRSHVIKIELGNAESLCNSISDFVFVNHGTTIPNEDIITVLKKVVVANHIHLSINDESMVNLMIPINHTELL